MEESEIGGYQTTPMIKNTLSALIVSVFLFGCATTPTRPEEAKQAPQNRLLAYQEKKPETSSTMVVTRDAGFLGGQCYYALSINGVLAARLDTGETARFFLAPGEVLLRAGRDPQGKGFCALNQDVWTQRESILRPHETKFFRFSIDLNGQTDIQRADQ